MVDRLEKGIERERERGVVGEDISNKTNEEIREKVKEWDVKEWKREMNERKSLKMYKEWRDEIGKQEKMYDIRLTSVLLFRCRTNTLNINDRNRFKRESTACQLCGNEREDLELLHAMVSSI